MYDMIIRGGTVIDPAEGTAEKRDIYIKDGKFAAPGNEDAGWEIGAEGCYVTPGLIDAHVHVNESCSMLGTKADILCPPSCVTTAIDPGSAGIYNFKGFYQNDIVPSWTTIKAAVSPTKYGVETGAHEEIPDPCYGTLEVLRPLFEQYKDTLVGIKQRVNYEVTGEYGLASLEQSVKTAKQLREEGYRCHVMVHFGPLAEGIQVEDVVGMLEPGDLMTHIYRPANGTTIFDQNGKVLDCMRRARERGVLFESGCARGHLSFDSVRKGFADGFQPDILSTDVVNYTAFKKPSGWLMVKMALYLNAGMTLEQVVKAVTYTPAKTWGLLEEAGTLEIGRPADAAIFRMYEKDYTMKDLYGGEQKCDRMLVPMATIKRGKVAFQQIFM